MSGDSGVILIFNIKMMSLKSSQKAMYINVNCKDLCLLDILCVYFTIVVSLLCALRKKKNSVYFLL